MNGALAKNLGREKLRQLLAATKGDKARQKPRFQATDYSWHEPHHFTSEQLKKLSQFADKIAEMIDQHLMGLYRGEIKVKIDSSKQHFASDIVTRLLDSKPKDYCLAFGDGQKGPTGFVIVPGESVFGWVSQLLGDTQEEQDKNRALSQLEESLLADVAGAIINAVCDSFKSSGGSPLQKTGDMHRGECPVVLSPTEELWEMGFAVEVSGKTAQCCVVMLSSRLKAIVGITPVRGGEITPQEARERIINNLNRISVGVEARLGSAYAVMQEIVDLQPGDILLLDKRVDEPIEVLVEGKSLFCGRPAKSSEKYAVVITAAEKD